MTLNDGGACFVMLAYGNYANMYFATESGGNVYVRKFIRQLSDVEVTTKIKVQFSLYSGNEPFKSNDMEDGIKIR